MDEILDRGEALERLKALLSDDDTEAAHRKADDVLVALIRGLGWNDVADAYDAIGKWYA